MLEGATYVYQLRGVMQANQERGGTVIYSTVLSSPITVTVLSVPKPIIAPDLTATAGNARSC